MTPHHQEQRCAECGRTEWEHRQSGATATCSGYRPSNPPPSDPHEGTWTICPRGHLVLHRALWAVGESYCWHDGCHEPLIELVPASTLQSLTAQRDEAIKRAEEAEADHAQFLRQWGLWDEERGVYDRREMYLRARAKTDLTQLQAAHRADLGRLADLVIAGDMAQPGEIAQEWQDAVDLARSLIQSLSTKDTDDASEPPR